MGEDAPIRILMIHGTQRFAESGPDFRVKTRKFAGLLRESLSQTLALAPDDIDFVYPTAPLPLRPSDSTCTIEARKGEEHRDADDSIGTETSLYGWWKNRDDPETEAGMSQSIASLAEVCRTQGPFAGVVGFSQGAALAAMFASWCESEATPGRKEALRRVLELDRSLPTVLEGPPQSRPLSFAVCFSGYRERMKYYRGFFEPPIETPVFNVLGTLDTLIERRETMNLVSACRNTALLEHPGVHFVPNDPQLLKKAVALVVGEFARPMNVRGAFPPTPPMSPPTSVAPTTSRLSSGESLEIKSSQRQSLGRLSVGGGYRGTESSTGQDEEIARWTFSVSSPALSEAGSDSVSDVTSGGSESERRKKRRPIVRRYRLARQ